MPAFFHQQYGCFEWLYSAFSSDKLFLLQLQSCSGREGYTNNIIQKHVSHLYLFFKEWFNNFHHQEELVNNLNKQIPSKKCREFGGPKFFWRHSWKKMRIPNYNLQAGCTAKEQTLRAWSGCKPDILTMEMVPTRSSYIVPKLEKVLHHLESRWSNPHVLVYHGPWQNPPNLGLGPSTFTTVYTHLLAKMIYPIGSMYGIFTYIWLIFMETVGKYANPMHAMGILTKESPKTQGLSNKNRHLEAIESMAVLQPRGWMTGGNSSWVLGVSWRYSYPQTKIGSQIHQSWWISRINEETGVKKGRIQKGTSDFCDVDKLPHTYILYYFETFWWLPIVFQAFLCLDGGSLLCMGSFVFEHQGIVMKLGNIDAIQFL